MVKRKIKDVLVIVGVIALFVSLGLPNQTIGNMMLMGVIVLSLLLHLFNPNDIIKQDKEIIDVGNPKENGLTNDLNEFMEEEEWHLTKNKNLQSWSPQSI